jgi:hypothetical protein
MRGPLGVRLVDRQERINGMILVTDKEHGEFTDDESLPKQLATVLSHELRNLRTPVRNGIYGFRAPTAWPAPSISASLYRQREAAPLRGGLSALVEKAE